MRFNFLNIPRLKHIRTALALFIAIPFFAMSQKTNIENEFSLNGTWDIIFDDNNEGISKKWFLNENFEENPSKEQIAVPSCWEQIKQDYEGVGIYRTKFKTPQNWKNKIVELHFEAVNYKSEIWINDQVVGFHEGGYTPFSFRIDKLLNPGKENVLIVRVISPIILTDKNIDGLGRQEVPMWRGALNGGIWQDVSLKAKGTVGIKDVFIEPNISNNSARFNIEIENVKAQSEDTKVVVEISGKEGDIVGRKEGTLTALPGKNVVNWNFNIKNAIYWDVENPYLYKAKVYLIKENEISDSWSHRFGMREFTVKNNQFYLNNNPLYLKAAFFEGLYPIGLAYPDSKEMAIKEIKLAKEAGFNMIRPWRKPAPKMWLDLCDEMGVLTVGSLAVECMHRPISTPRLPFVVENELRQTILSNRNRTCIVQWELFNEINRPILAQMLNSMSVLARELDPTRMILDESGGWGEGANIYLPFERTPTKFNDIHHYSGSQVNEKEFNGYLVTGKTKEEAKKYGLQKGFGKNVVPGIMSYISELGYGSTPNLTENLREFKKKGNPITAVYRDHFELDEGYRNILKETGFDKIYPDVTDFYLEQQKMHGIANKRMIEATRLNNMVGGYCVHALTGGDWVLGAGLLDLWRNPKTLVYDLTKEANQPQIAPIRILPRNVYAEQGAYIEIHGVSELESENVTLGIAIKSEKGKRVFKNSITKDFNTGISELFSTKLNTSDMDGAYEVFVTIKNDKGELIVSNNQSFDVFKKISVSVAKEKVAIVDPENSLAPFLKNEGIAFEFFSKGTDINTTVIVGNLKKKNEAHKELVNSVNKFVEKGGYAIMLDVMGTPIGARDRILVKNGLENIPFDIKLLQPWDTRGGWAAKSHITTEHPIFMGLPTNQIMHGVYENIHPKNSMAMQEGNYIAGMIGYDHFPGMDLMVRHFNGTGDVWYAADVLEAPMGKGMLLLSTLQILEFLGKDPVADKVLINMIDYASKQ
ncbi:glycoside hydrolase family 2 protein [Urechidicola vernalis]|uniref:Glycoside hydrolase family 2 TIM barrel-domain containing protein n=1 Tax=Urechidicola vernalis TaxID=3075600 RepID=A0ABU2Y0X8_9FLAO|nr:sugar-binding domain-containing protein [Urechidicola sp. P050]MDT0551828.1 glycoside hydrolase family 2 TIM barrel-domain containing protein [Urechidicola sp. P050]